VGSTPERLVVGRIAKLHGLNGEVVVEVLSDAPDRFARGSKVQAGDPDAATRTLTVSTARVHQNRLLVRFYEVPDRSTAEPLHGALLSIAASDAAPLPEGRYYSWQLEGLEVVDEEGRISVRWTASWSEPATTCGSSRRTTAKRWSPPSMSSCARLIWTRVASSCA